MVSIVTGQNSGRIDRNPFIPNFRTPYVAVQPKISVGVVTCEQGLKVHPHRTTLRSQAALLIFLMGTVTDRMGYIFSVNVTVTVRESFSVNRSFSVDSDRLQVERQIDSFGRFFFFFICHLLGAGITNN